MAVLKIFAYFTNKIFFAVFLQYGLFICKAEVYYVFLEIAKEREREKGKRERGKEANNNKIKH